MDALSAFQTVTWPIPDAEGFQAKMNDAVPEAHTAGFSLLDASEISWGSHDLSILHSFTLRPTDHLIKNVGVLRVGGGATETEPLLAARW